MFLVQIVTKFLEGIYLTERIPSANAKVKNRLMGGNVSVGLAVKKFWNKITQVHQTMNRLNMKVLLGCFFFCFNLVQLTNWTIWSL